MSQIIEKKVVKKYFDQIQSGQKTFEIRLADWSCESGDTLVLLEIDDLTNEPTGRRLEKKVGTVVKTKDLDFWMQEEIGEHGYQVISLLDKDTE